jgi:RimJ/RimL family protein N-acetyltransferase
LSALTVVRADESAIPFVMATERTAGFEQFVGRWEEAQHRAALEHDPEKWAPVFGKDRAPTISPGRHAYFIGRDGAEPVGFVIVRDWASPERVTLVKRIAVGRPGLGYGRALLTGVVDAVFEQTNAWRVWLGVFPDNTRARRAYEALGFRAEGIARGSAFFYGVHRDELVMAVLRPEWEARVKPGPSSG